MEDVARNTRLTKRGATYWFKAKVPKDLQGRGRFVTSKGTPKTEEAFTLRTRDPEAARRLVVEASLKFDRECDQLRRELAAREAPPTRAPEGAPAQADRSSLVSLSYRQCVALSGRWLREMLEVYEAHPDNKEGNALGLDLLADAEGDPREQERIVGPHLDRQLDAEGLVVDTATRRLLVLAFRDAMANHLRAAVRQDGGDFSPAPELVRYPAASVVEKASPPEPVNAPVGGKAITIDDVIDGWAANQGASPQARDTYARTLFAFAATIKPRSLAEASKQDVVDWKAALQAAGRTASTIVSYMNRCSTLYAWAVDDGLLPSNPFVGVRRPRVKRGRGRLVRPFTEAEAVTILTAARERQGFARWVPWLMAFSGARVAEVCQAMVADVREVDGIPCLMVTEVDEDGQANGTKSVKSEASVRAVPIHPKVVSEGFLDYAHGLPADGPLFPDITLDKYGLRGSTAANALRSWVRGLGITDDRISPNHSWRHRVKDLLRNALVPPEVQDAILGHEAGRNAGDGYGLGFSVTVLHDHLCRINVPDGL
ncbi:DUF6538 domain-containing protein [Inquilinus sp. Marseille-Q2685]|uniref:DUF6538 domain-containing protein n=1 Tax=Inquilinus sp. Marseille-Q2685 TaxID=2866581 RepID=UPI001CE49850|nr:DUF6538 domain-containing protein [Inquilinus sp. Marseille-Q2685]